MFNTKFLIIKLIHFLILSTFYVGIGLAFLFNDLSYLKISGIGFSYFILNKFNIPVLSPIVRSFTWEIAKQVIWKQIKDNPIEVIMMMRYLDENTTPKQIYIKYGIESLETHLNERSKSEMENIKQSMQSFSKIQESFRKGKEQGINRNEIENTIIQDLNNMVPVNMKSTEPESEKSKQVQRGVASLILDFEELKMNLEELKDKGTSEEELKKISQEGFKEILKSLTEKFNTENGNKQQ